jgi:hypothetical protein
MWQLTGGGDKSLTALLRTTTVRLARAVGGGVEYWLELPIWEMLQFMFEVADQLKEENAAMEQARRR